jgi:N-acyl homoserine lactone hydrolase
MHAHSSITITPILVADLGIEGERMPVYAHLIDHPDGPELVWLSHTHDPWRPPTT